MVSLLDDSPEIDVESGRDVQFRIAAGHDDRIAAFELVYRKYFEAEFIPQNEFRLRVTPYHLLPTTNVIVALAGSRVVSTVTLIGDGELGVPMESIYGKEILERRRKNLYIGEVSCLAFEPMPLNKSLQVLMQLTRLMAQHALTYGMDQLMIAVHPQHARFYRRFMGFEIVGPLKTYPSVQHAPAVACCLDFRAINKNRPKCWESYFGARLPEADLCSRPMSDDECDYFRPIAQLAGYRTPQVACTSNTGI